VLCTGHHAGRFDRWIQDGFAGRMQACAPTRAAIIVPRPDARADMSRLEGSVTDSAM
jgi:hypothetical protein